jgi:hypothetical protein
MPRVHLPRLTRRGALRFLGGLCVLVAACGVTAALAFRAGKRAVHPAATVATHTGRVYAGGVHDVSIYFGGQWYGVDTDVSWIDGQGTIHLGSWPACLPPGGSSSERRKHPYVTFGSVDDTRPTGVRTVVWVRC